MNTKPDDEYGHRMLERLNCEPWMVDLLALNPDYPHWGPGDDYMAGKGDGPNSAVEVDGWREFKFDLDDYNEVVNFYFDLDRDNERCVTCAGTGYHPDAQWITESFYSHSSPFKHQDSRERMAEAVMERFSGPAHRLHGHGSFPPDDVLARYGDDFRAFCKDMRRRGHWSDVLDDADYEALRKAGRDWHGPFGHDAINRDVLCEARCARYGVPLKCPQCEGHGYVFTAPAGQVSLVMWILHPRKGASRGVEVTGIRQNDLPNVFSYLRKAAARNAARFARIPAFPAPDEAEDVGHAEGLRG